MHAAQGSTVDTSHAVDHLADLAGRALRRAVPRPRRQHRPRRHHHARSTTPPRARSAHQLHRDPVAVLAGLLDTDDPVATRSALAIATESAHDAGSVRTAAELLADAAQLAATERTAVWLDQLTTAGALTPEQRARLAAEDGAASLARILRRAELAGHDPARSSPTPSPTAR